MSARKEIVAVLLILAAALLVRGWAMSGNTIDHFDEGVYSFSALGLADASQPRVMYPNQEIFSPPVYFATGAVLARAFGMAPDIALMWISIVFGALTVLVVWWFVREEFGAAAGLTAAAILAFNPFHIEFSRSALTDITFTFWFVLGIAALVPYAWRLRAGRRNWVAPIQKWSGAALVAFLCYLPWMIYLRTRAGGYEALARHYLGHLRTQWFANFWRYGEILAFFETPLGRVAVVAAPLVTFALIVRKPVAMSRMLVLFGFLALSALILGAAGTALLFSLIATPWLLRNKPTYRIWVLFAWASIWLLAAPVYNPYARLILPFVVACSIGAAIGFMRLLRWYQEPDAGLVPARLQWVMVPLFAVVLFLAGSGVPTGADPWRKRGMSEAAAAFSQQIPEGSRVIAMIEPTIAYYLHRNGRPAFERTSRFEILDTLSTPAYVITGTYVRRSPRLQKQLARRSKRLAPLATARIVPYDVRLLDDLTPAEAKRYRAHSDSTFDLRLYRYEPPVKR